MRVALAASKNPIDELRGEIRRQDLHARRAYVLETYTLGLDFPISYITIPVTMAFTNNRHSRTIGTL